MLVVDDLHRLEHPGALRVLQCMLDHAPAPLHLALATRHAPRLSLARPRAAGLTEELDARALRFTEEESLAFTRLHLDAIAPRDAQRLHERSDGWVTGLDHLCRERAGAGGDALASCTAYFEREVLPRLSTVEIGRLERLSACRRFCPSLCAALQAGEGRGAGLQDVADAALLIERLVDHNVFVSPTDSADPDPWYALHPQWREVLWQRAQRLGADELRRLHASAASWFEARGLVDDAVRHAVHAGNLAAAASMVEQCARALFIRGELRTLAKLLRQLPSELLAQRSSLQQWIARLQLYARQFDACRDTIHRMDRLASDAEAHFELAILRGAVALQCDDSASAHALLSALLAPPPEADGLAIGSRNNLVCWIHTHAGEHSAAARIHAQRPPPVNGGMLVGTIFGLLGARCMLGLSHAVEGRMVDAERAYRDVLHEASLRGGSCADPACLATALLGEVLHEYNEDDAAWKLLEDRAGRLHQVSIPDSVLRVHTVLGSLHWQAGRRSEASAQMAALEAHAAPLGLDRLLACAWRQQMTWHVADLAFEAAQALQSRLETLRTRHAGAPRHSTLSEIAVIAERSRIDLMLARGGLETAAAALPGLIALCEARAQWREAAACRMQLAVVAQRCGRPADAQAMATAALRLGHRLGLARSLLDAAPDAPALMRCLLELRRLPPLLDFYAERLLATRAGADPGTASRPEAVSLEALSSRESQILSLLAQALPNKKIAQSLGVSPETVKWHLKNVYGKLGVAGRDEAVARAKDLGNAVPELPLHR